MLLDTKTADEMQAALDEVFDHLPRHFRTPEVRFEIAKCVVRTQDASLYLRAACDAVRGVFGSVDRALARVIGNN
jgi:hypothetical protein